MQSVPEGPFLMAAIAAMTERSLSTLCTCGNHTWAPLSQPPLSAIGKVIEYVVNMWRRYLIASFTPPLPSTGKVIEYVASTWQQERLLSTLCTRGNRKGYWVCCVHEATGKAIEYVVDTWHQERLLSTLWTWCNRKGYWEVHCVHVATGKFIEYVGYTWQQERLSSYWVRCVHVATGKVIEYIVYTTHTWAPLSPLHCRQCSLPGCWYRWGAASHPPPPPCSSSTALQ